ncbi:hypothetical protein BN873_310021 [Candidatus Competibacter denitrificans Run_A_D11]|uniref:Helix-turn-helix domain-containing protein n=1 Tax=Candidatus Competibacter denitrificans Run_A_D11 TaxID=1400863 RepID=W6M486_9GAMM|nr:hypothetical protein BN873_310021 [Candidatus Competibacter denitrificans Run_A_D11]HAS85295.1 DNA-binding protein [Candidatus Competibacteraceae bacterium]
MIDTLLCDLKETARQLGNISVRTVYRMIENKELSTVPVGRRVMVTAASLHRWVEQHADNAYANDSVGPSATDNGICKKQNQITEKTKTGYTDAMTRRTGGPVLPTQAAAELAVVLKLPTAKTQKRCLQNGGLPPTSRSTGINRRRTPSTN